MHIPTDTAEFLMRWKRKGMHYNFDDLSQCFDGFFTSFVLYNLLYDHICETEPLDFPYKFDNERATKAVKKYLGAHMIYTDSDVQANALIIKDLIYNRTFYIRDQSWDQTRIDKLTSNDPEQWSAAILEIVYKIRCNTFHGHKSFDNNQKSILIPNIKILRRLNDMLLQKMMPDYFNNRRLRGPQLKKLE